MRAPKPLSEIIQTLDQLREELVHFEDMTPEYEELRSRNETSHRWVRILTRELRKAKRGEDPLSEEEIIELVYHGPSSQVDEVTSEEMQKALESMMDNIEQRMSDWDRRTMEDGYLAVEESEAILDKLERKGFLHVSEFGPELLKTYQILIREFERLVGEKIEHHAAYTDGLGLEFRWNDRSLNVSPLPKDKFGCCYSFDKCPTFYMEFDSIEYAVCLYKILNGPKVDLLRWMPCEYTAKSVICAITYDESES